MPFSYSKFSTGVGATASSAFAKIGTSIQRLATAIQEVLEQEKHVTRPYEDSFAILTLRDLQGNVLCSTDQFILSSAVEGDQERSSFRFTLGDPSLYAGAGRNPKIYTYSGFIVDTYMGPNLSIWRKIYDKFFRGTSAVKKKAYLELTTRDLYRRGYLLSYTLGIEASNPQLTPLNFSMFVIKETNRT